MLPVGLTTSASRSPTSAARANPVDAPTVVNKIQSP
jgi:hypothetical protein